MNIIVRNDTFLVLNLEPKEELHETLLNFCDAEGIIGGTFTGLGACSSASLAYYNLKSKSYEQHEIVEDLEILSLTGNIGMLDGKSMLHVHGVFGRRGLSTLGGHIFKLRVSGACEIHLTTLPTPLSRSFDEATGLNLLCGITE